MELDNGRSEKRIYDKRLLQYIAPDAGGGIMQALKTKYVIELLDSLVCQFQRCEEAISAIKSGKKCTVRISDPEVICLKDAIKGEIIPLIEKQQDILRGEIADKQDEIRRLIRPNKVPDCPDPPKPPNPHSANPSYCKRCGAAMFFSPCICNMTNS